ncbi:TadG family pilus assembly protein [[Pseudomonas] boreopolis]|uniref:TadG family pilus assembly protein n=1 Tax=Xanthomonas boreopolis TaxID=86183 RepID=UPI003DA00F9D
MSTSIRPSSSTSPSGPRAIEGQRGAAAVTILLLMLSLVAMLGLVEVGYLYWTKRDLQKVADLAALAGAGRLDQCNASNSDNAAARGNAVNDNSFAGTLAIQCGYWNPSNPGDDHFVSATSATPVNAVKVVAQRSPVPFFHQIESLPTISASAVAWRSSPQVAFTVGSQLLNVNGQAPLQQVLKLVGVDIDNTTVLGYQGLANLQITPRGLLEALGIGVGTDLTVGGYNALLRGTSISVGKLLEIMAQLASQQGLLGVDLSLLQQKLASAELDKVEIKLGSSESTPGLFASIIGPITDPAAGLDIQLNALDLIGGAVSIAGSGHAVAIGDLQVLGSGVTVKSSIVEPPSIGVGPVGTTAYNAQVRLFVDIDTNNLTALLSSVFKLLGTRLKLPIYIDVIDGYATASAIDCTSTPKNATFDVVSAIANVCVGKATVDWTSTRDMCATGLQNEQLLTLFSLPLLNSQIKLPALADRQSLTVDEGETGSTEPNRLLIGDTVANLVNALLNLLGDLLSPSSSDSSTASTIATQYLEATKDPSGRYNAANVIPALRNGINDLGALGTWETNIPTCNLLTCWKARGDVWQGFLNSTQIGGSLLGSVLDLLGLTACDGLLTQLLAYNNCVRNNLANYLQTKPDGLDNLGSYNPSSGAGSCGGVVCLLLRPVVDSVLRPLLNALGGLLSNVLASVLGLELGRTDVHVQSIQCHSAQLVH